MGCWDIYCIICGLPCHSEKGYIEIAEETGDEYIIKETKKVIRKIGYLNKITFLSADDRIIRNCRETDCNIHFVSPSREEFLQIGNGDLGYGMSRGLFIHTPCWKWIKESYNIELKYSDLPINIMHNVTTKKFVDNPIPHINYGPVMEYWSQYFDYIKMIENNDMYIVDRNNPKNIARMKKIVTQYKLKNDPKRIGPSVSATFLKMVT